MQNQPAAGRRNVAVAVWLFCIAAMVFAMVVLGGVTRLSHAGLSMVEWKPLTGWLPPMNESEWDNAFASYRQYPEYRKLNVGMTLSSFKSIFWLEYGHRLWGRLIGVAFIVPLSIFLLKRRLDRPLTARLVIIFIFGGLQGLLGWYMVKSGLADEPDVSQYRLTAHLGAALVIFGYVLWVALDLSIPPKTGPETGSSARRLRRPHVRSAVAVAGLILVTALSGSLVAGLDAGFIYNTFPLMEGRAVPDHLFEARPWYLNPFENIITVQFDHRVLALVLLAAVAIFWLRARRSGLEPDVRYAVNALAAMTAVQVALGISTLLLVVPPALAVTHQAGALVLFGIAVWVVHALRLPDRPPQSAGENPTT